MMPIPKFPLPDKSKAVSIKRDFYTMATSDGSNAEITMYGEIVDSVPVDFWTGEKVDGQYIVEGEFLDDLKAVEKCDNITLRMNSCGGDAQVSITIHNRLRELARAGTKLTCVVDGVAMSGGSLIMCACDTVKANPSSLIMIHKAWSFLFGGYNADEMRKAADESDSWDKSQVEIYKRKTGLSDTVLMHMMSNTTYMTGKEAVEKGFADELLEDTEPLNIAASADGRSLFVRGHQVRLTSGLFAPDYIPTAAAGTPSAAKNNPSATPTKEENPMANTIEELQQEYPDLTNQMQANARAAAIQSERARLQEIDEVACLYSEADVTEAKYGQTACSAAELTHRMALASAKKNAQNLTALDDDAKASGAASVPAAAAPIEEPKQKPEAELTPDQRMANARAAVGELFDPKS